MTKAQKRAQRKATRASARARKAGGSKRKSAKRRTAGRRKGGKATVARRNLRKARSARKRNKARGGPRHKVKGFSYSRKAKRVRVPSHMSYEDKPRKKRRSSKRRRQAAEASESPKKRSRRSSRRRSGGRRRKLSMKKSAVAARRRRRMAGESTRRSSRKRRSSGRRRHKVRGHMAKTRGSRRKHRVKAHMSNETSRRRRRSSRRRRSGGRRRRSSGRRRTGMSRRRGYALENPLSAKEIAWGAVTGTLGFLAADALDRVWATHALGPASGGGVGTDGKPLWGDTPPAAGTGIFKTNYVGLYNATAILAPMDWKRWVSGALITGIPFALAMAIKNPVGRSSMQFFGFGAGVRILGKAVDDLMAKLFGRTSWGARLYDGEARAAAIRNLNEGGPDTTGNFPTAGLGSLPESTGVAGCNCANCSAGVGACCRRSDSAALPPPVGVPTAGGQMPNPVVPAPAPMAPPQAAPPQGTPRTFAPAPALPSPVTFAPPGMLAGLPRRPEAQVNGARKSPYAWSGVEDKAAE